jgi:hypothetical protein
METEAIMTAAPKTRWLDWSRSMLLRRIAHLRIEEFIAYFFFVPCLAITMRANFFFWLQGYGLGRKIVGGMWRMMIVAAMLPLISYVSRKSDGSRAFAVFRNSLPFLIAILIYTNLHDTIHFVNPHDVQEWFLRADIWLFGVEPTLWAERFYRPWLTEMLAFFYASYLPMTILIPALLYYKRKDRDARETLVGIVLCFYVGYFLYIAFPTVPPRLYISHLYTQHLEGGLMMAAQRGMVTISESSSRAAFPSLHAGITLLTLMYSYRFLRKLFWFLLPQALMLLTATIYLRHHYVVDLFAGFALALAAHRWSPACDAGWERFRRRLLQLTEPKSGN